MNEDTAAVVQLTEQSLPIPYDLCSNPATGNFLGTVVQHSLLCIIKTDENKVKETGNFRFLIIEGRLPPFSHG